MFVDDLRSKKRHLEAKQQQRAVIIAASSDWVPERLKTIDRGNPNQPKNIVMSKQTIEIHRNSIPRTSWEPYTIPKKRVSGDHAFSSTTNDWVPSKYYSKNNSNKNLHPQLNRNNVVTSSYPPIPLVTTSKSNSNSTASQSTTLANNNSINNIVGTVSCSNSDIDYDIETVNSGDSFDEYTEYNDKSTANSNNVLLTDHFKVNDGDILSLIHI